jgi:hypothetical protein
VGHVQRARGDNCCRQYASAFPHVLTLPAYDDSRSGHRNIYIEALVCDNASTAGTRALGLKVFSRCPPSGCGAAAFTHLVRGGPTG